MRTFAKREPFLQLGTPNWSTSSDSNRCFQAGNLQLINRNSRPTTCCHSNTSKPSMVNRWCSSRAKQQRATRTFAPIEACAWVWRPVRQRNCSAGTTDAPSIWMEPSGTCRNSQRQSTFQQRATTWRRFHSSSGWAWKQWFGKIRHSGIFKGIK